MASSFSGERSLTGSGAARRGLVPEAPTGYSDHHGEPERGPSVSPVSPGLIWRRASATGVRCTESPRHTDSGSGILLRVGTGVLR